MESHKLDPWPLDEGPRPKSGKSKLNLHGAILEGKSIGLNCTKKNYDLKNFRCNPKSKVWFKDLVYLALPTKARIFCLDSL
jgi:hypothetical protein